MARSRRRRLGESSTASFFHFDDEGNNLGDGFSVSRSSYFPLGIGLVKLK
jgi:hypothetical protein